jgi:hypothetical protein
VSILIAAGGVGRYFGSQQRAKVSMTIMRLPQIQPSQSQPHAEQEPHSSHDEVVTADAYARLGKMQLEPADVLHSRRLG